MTLVAAACGSDGPADPGDTLTSVPDGAAAAPAGSTEPSVDPAVDDFPVTVAHALGTTEVAAEPQRIVSVGLTEQDYVLALDVVPVGVTEWYGEHPFATWPWAQDELGDAQPEVLSTADGFNYERIAALDPDLILGLNAGLDEQSYQQLSRIAPTIAHAEGQPNWFGSWRTQADLIGRALGRTAQMDSIVADIDTGFAAAAAAHPEFAGQQIVFLQNAFYDGAAIAYQDGLSTEFLTDLGFEIPAVLDEFADPAAAQAYIPLEHLAVLDAADVLLWATEGPTDRAALESEPLYTALEEVREGRQVFTDGLLAGAIYFTSPLSLPVVLERLVPALASTLAGEGPADASTAETDASRDGEQPVGDEFPVTIDHKYGEVTIEATPTRVAVVGLVEQDALLALGVVPVATTEWFGEHPGAVFPWAQDELEALGADPPASLGTSAAYNFEAVAAQDPDLIIGVYSGMTADDYEKFASIAPTVAQPGDYVDYGVPWQELTVTVGAAVGKRHDAEVLVGDVEASFERARAEHPEFVGASALMGTPYEGVFLYGPEDPRGRFLSALGFELPPDLAEITGDEFGGNLSTERLDYLDVDAMVWLDFPLDAERPEIEVYRQLPVHQAGRDTFLDSFSDPLGAATSFVTVLSLPYLLDGLVPKLAAAVDGDPATVVPGQ